MEEVSEEEEGCHTACVLGSSPLLHSLRVEQVGAEGRGGLLDSESSCACCRATTLGPALSPCLVPPSYLAGSLVRFNNSV